MVTVTPRGDGTYAIESTSGPQFLLVNITWLAALLEALQDAGMIQMNGQVLTRPRR